jgi:hypothetical protein
VTRRGPSKRSPRASPGYRRRRFSGSVASLRIQPLLADARYVARIDSCGIAAVQEAVADLICRDAFIGGTLHNGHASSSESAGMHAPLLELCLPQPPLSLVTDAFEPPGTTAVDFLYRIATEEAGSGTLYKPGQLLCALFHATATYYASDYYSG